MAVLAATFTNLLRTSQKNFARIMKVYARPAVKDAKLLLLHALAAALAHQLHNRLIFFTACC
jgi:hypothetical protein